MNWLLPSFSFCIYYSLLNFCFHSAKSIKHSWNGVENTWKLYWKLRTRLRDFLSQHNLLFTTCILNLEINVFFYFGAYWLFHSISRRRKNDSVTLEEFKYIDKIWLHWNCSYLGNKCVSAMIIRHPTNKINDRFIVED